MRLQTKAVGHDAHWRVIRHFLPAFFTFTVDVALIIHWQLDIKMFVNVKNKNISKYRNVKNKNFKNLINQTSY